MRDAYTKLFERIDVHEFFKIAINDITYIEEEKIRIQWDELKERVFNNGEIYIRGYGRDAVKTKNPLLFGCGWNIAYIPKYIDPFTGHETQGCYSEEFKKILKINSSFTLTTTIVE